jgi:glycosyltransferase involved in cell wall biosynthesis
MRNLKRVYNCIDLPLVAPSAGTREQKGLTFLYVGRFVPDKGIASLVYGFERALKEFPENRLLTVGPQESSGGADSRFFRVMSRYLKERALSSKVEFMPPIFDKERLNALIASADVICVPSLSGETFSMAILEAMALAKPVLVSDFCPMPEAVDHKVTGYVAKLGDADSIAEGIRFFSENASHLRDFGLAGFRKASEFFSVQRIAREYLADFADLQSLRAGKVVPETVEPISQR